MDLNRKQFDILETLAVSETALSQRKLEEITNYSLGTINRVMKELTENGWAKDGKITNRGLEALEPFRAKRAIFIAAGFGSRLVPITFNTPKPLVRVHGVRIIDRLIDACLEAGITEIYIVRGYLGELFDQLLYKYPMIKFLENPVYNEANNISSALVARYLLSNAYVFEADLLISNPKIIHKYHYSSDFLGIKKERSDDWCFRVKDGVITEEKVGGEGKISGKWSVFLTGTKLTATSCFKIFRMYMLLRAERKDTGNRFRSYIEKNTIRSKFGNALTKIS